MEERIESFCAMIVAVNPAVPVRTRKPRMPSSVIAQIVAMSAIEARPIQRFVQLVTQSSPSQRAKVVMHSGSDPAVD